MTSKNDILARMSFAPWRTGVRIEHPFDPGRKRRLRRA